jgi:hypothetical protein
MEVIYLKDKEVFAFRLFKEKLKTLALGNYTYSIFITSISASHQFWTEISFS